MPGSRKLSCSAQTHLESIIFFAASAYLNSSFRASSLYLIRDNLSQTHQESPMSQTPEQVQQIQADTKLRRRSESYLMGMSFMTSLNMDGEMTGSQSLGSSGS